MSLLGVLQSYASAIGPWFTQQRHLGSLKEVFGLTLDMAEATLETGLRMTHPLRADRSALPKLAYDRTITLYSGESEASQRTRLANWLPLHKQRGTHQGELRHLQPYFLPAVPLLRIVHQPGDGGCAVWHTLNAEGVYSVHTQTPSNWDFDGRASLWSRFWLIISPPAALWTPNQIWDGLSLWDTPGFVYDGLSTTDALNIINLVKGWKSAHSRLAGVILTTDGESTINPTATAVTNDHWTTMPTGNWGSPVSNGYRTRNPAAHFIYEDNP